MEGGFPVGAYHKLKQWKIGAHMVQKRTNDNAYQIELPSDLDISNVFNVADLSRFYGDESDDHNLRMGFSQAREDC